MTASNKSIDLGFLAIWLRSWIEKSKADDDLERNVAYVFLARNIAHDLVPPKDQEMFLKLAGLHVIGALLVAWFFLSIPFWITGVFLDLFGRQDEANWIIDTFTIARLDL